MVNQSIKKDKRNVASKILTVLLGLIITMMMIHPQNAVAVDQPDTKDTIVKVTKTWDDNELNNCPSSVHVRLMDGTNKVAEGNIKAQDGWMAKFKVPKKNASYVIQEDEITGYEVGSQTNPTVDYTPFKVGDLGKYTPNNNLTIGLQGHQLLIVKKGNYSYIWTTEELKSLDEKKAVIDAGKQLPELKNALNNPTFIYGNVKIDGLTVNNEGISFEDQHYWSFIAYGTYIPESTVVTDGSITNKLQTVNVSGTKMWDDAENQDGIRPDSITINLMANGKKVGE